jgi:septum formation protein
VITGLCLLHEKRAETHASITDVYFYDLKDEEIDTYVKSGQAYDKAGAYGIQDEGAFFIHKIDGDYYTVMGLPIALLKHRLERFIDTL